MAETCGRKFLGQHGFSQSSCYCWRKKYAGGDVSLVREHRRLSRENARYIDWPGLSLSTAFYRKWGRPDDQPVIERMRQLARKHPRFGLAADDGGRAGGQQQADLAGCTGSWA